MTRDTADEVAAASHSAISKQPSRPKGIDNFKEAVFLVILALGVLERLSRVANLISIERDWVPTLTTTGVDDKQLVKRDLTRLNALLSRIDLICKLGAPIVMSMTMSTNKLAWLSPLAVLGLNSATWPLECWTAQEVWHENDQLQEPKPAKAPSTCILGAGKADFNRWEPAFKVCNVVLSWLRDYSSSLRLYFSTDVWMPSLAITALHFSVLGFSGTLTVFLVNSGFSLRLITCAEVLSAAFEISSTYVFPWGVRILSMQGKDYYALASSATYRTPASLSRLAYDMEDENQTMDGPLLQKQQRRGVSRLGIRALSVMLLCLVSTGSKDELQIADSI